MERVSAVSAQAAGDKATVIIVNWNGQRFLHRGLTALMGQTTKPHEIILVDNASTDDSVSIVRQFPAVRLIALDRNAGFARANNLAIEAAAAESEWIVLLNPDAYAEPGWLQELIAAARRNPGYDVFGSKLLNAADRSLLDGIGDAYHLSGLVWRRGHGVPDGHGAQQEQEVFSPCAAAAMYRRSALQKVGGFDEDYFCYVEDVDLGFRLRLAGYRCLYVPKSVALHVGSGTTGSQHSDFAVYHGHRNLVWTFVKDMPGILLWLLLPIHLLMNILTVCVFVLRGQGRVIFKAKRDALSGLPAIWRKRTQIQTRRAVLPRVIWQLLDKSFFKHR